MMAALVLSACNLPEDSAASQELMMTAAALTVESALKTPLATPTLANTPEVVAGGTPVSYTHLRAHETVLDLVCRLLLEKNTKKTKTLHTMTYNHEYTR